MKGQESYSTISLKLITNTTLKFGVYELFIKSKMSLYMQQQFDKSISSKSVVQLLLSIELCVIYGLYSRHDTERKEKSLSLSPFPLSWVVFPLVRSPIPFSRSDKWGMGGLEEGDAVTFHEEIFPGHFWWRGSPAICITLCRSSTCTRARQL